MSNVVKILYTQLLLIDTGRRPACIEEPGCIIDCGRLQIGNRPALRATNGWIKVATSHLKKGAVLTYGPDNGPWQVITLSRDLGPGAEWLYYNANTAGEQRAMLTELARDQDIILRP